MLKASWGVLFYVMIIQEVVASGHNISCATSSYSTSLADHLDQLDFINGTRGHKMGQEMFEDSQPKPKLSG